MTMTLDAGPIARQADLSLEGDIEEIFNRISTIGVNLTIDIISNGFNSWIRILVVFFTTKNSFTERNYN